MGFVETYGRHLTPQECRHHMALMLVLPRVPSIPQKYVIMSLWHTHNLEARFAKRPISQANQPTNKTVAPEGAITKII